MIVTLWEEKIDVINISKSYKVAEFMVQEFNTIKILSLRNIEEIDDIGPVQENTEDLHLQTSNYIFNANISAVKNLETYNACVSCKGRVEPLTPPGGHCSRRDYGMFQRIDRCST